MRVTVIRLLTIAAILLGAVIFGARWLRPALQSGSSVTESPTATPFVTPLADDMVVVDEPLPLASISSPLRVAGKARGTWFFEGSFPVILTDWDGRIIATVPAQAQGEWMTTDWVPFEASITFSKPSYGVRGSLILKKDNPSGLPEHDDAREMTIFFR